MFAPGDRVVYLGGDWATSAAAGQAGTVVEHSEYWDFLSGTEDTRVVLFDEHPHEQEVLTECLEMEEK